MELAEQDSKAFDDLLAFLQSHPKIEKYEPANEPMISLPNLEIHLSKRKVFRGQQEIPFTKTEYDILLYLLQNVNRDVYKRQVTTMVGQCMGAKQIQRARKVAKIGLGINILVTLVVVIGVQLFAEQLILFFGNVSPEVVKDGVYYLRICCSINSLIYAAMYTLDSFAIGVGAANVAMINALLDLSLIHI